MSFQDEYKITSADRLDKGVYGLPDTPGMTTAAIQERFDSLGNLAIDKFNALVEAASDVIDGSDTKFPTNKAVQDYISGEGGAIIDDTTPSLHKAYSSSKVESMFSEFPSELIDDSGASATTVYSSSKVEEIVADLPTPESVIDDDTASTDTTYSSSKLESDFISVSDTEEQTATDEFTTINGGLLSSLKVSLSPNQDLHGYDSPWVGGASKNKLPMTLANIIALNTDGTWNGNTYTFRGIDYTVLVDDANNIIGFDTNGTATQRGWFFITEYDFGETDAVYNNVTVGGYIFTAGNSAYIDNQKMIYYNHGSKRTYFIMDGITTNHEKWYPMVRLSSESDPTFEPYSNICPISGHTQVDVDVSDGDTTQEQVTVNLGGTYYSGTLDVVTGVFTPDTADAIYDGSVDENWGVSGFYANTVIIVRPADCAGNDDAISEQYKRLSNASDLSTEEGFFIASNINIHDNQNAIDVATWKAYLANNPVKVVYPLANPTPIQLSPTMVKALVGENHLSAPLEGQEITESVYSPLAKWNAVIDDTTASNDTTYSSNKINTIVPKIDDNATSASKVFSSLKTANLITELSERFDFSTTEKPLGWWTDGKVYYGKVINIAGCPKEMFGLMVDLGVEVDTFIGIFAVGNAKDDNYNGGYCMGGTIYCKVIKSEGQNTQIQPACAVMALGGASLLVLYTKVEE